MGEGRGDLALGPHPGEVTPSPSVGERILSLTSMWCPKPKEIEPRLTVPGPHEGKKLWPRYMDFQMWDQRGEQRVRTEPGEGPPLGAGGSLPHPAPSWLPRHTSMAVTVLFLEAATPRSLQ